VHDDSCHGVRCSTIPQLGHVSPDVQMRRLPVVWAGERGARAPIGARDSGGNASLWVVTLHHGAYKRRIVKLFTVSPCFALNLNTRLLDPPTLTSLRSGSLHSCADSAFLTCCWLQPPPYSPAGFTKLIRLPCLSAQTILWTSAEHALSTR